MHQYTLYDRLDYFSHLIKRYNNAKPGDRIILATMEYRPDQVEIAQLVDGLCIAAQRGANVTFILDAYSLMLKDGSVLGPLFFRKKDPKVGYGHFKKVVESIHKLRDAGVQCHVVNKPTRPLKNPFSGRSHIKFAVYNDESFVGGCNLSHPELLDVMVHAKNSKLARELVQFTEKVIAHKNVRLALQRTDYCVKIDDHTELILDAGVRRQSLIYKKAFELIENAKKHVYMTCQYFPNHDTPHALTQAAKKGVRVHLAYNHPNKHRQPIRGAQKGTVAYKKMRFHESIFDNQLHHQKNYLHAKILVSESEAIVGSHNYVAMGVRLGTAEIALRSTSPDFIYMAQKWVEDL